MKVFKKILLFVARFLALIIIAIFLYLLLALILSAIKTRPQALECDQEYEVYLTNNGFHTDLILKVEDLPEQMISQLNLNPITKYLAFGWGDQAFYLETPTLSDLKAKTAFNALFFKAATVVHLEQYSRTYENWESHQICESQLQDIIVYLDKAFLKDKQGAYLLLKKSVYTSTDIFYQAKGNYHVFNTCNVWIGKALKKGGISTALWSPLGWGL